MHGWFSTANRFQADTITTTSCSRTSKVLGRPGPRLIQFAQAIGRRDARPRRYPNPRLIQSTSQMMRSGSSPRKCPNSRLIQFWFSSLAWGLSPRRCPNPRLIQFRCFSASVRICLRRCPDPRLIQCRNVPYSSASSPRLRARFQVDIIEGVGWRRTFSSARTVIFQVDTIVTL